MIDWLELRRIFNSLGSGAALIWQSADVPHDPENLPWPMMSLNRCIRQWLTVSLLYDWRSWCKLSRQTLKTLTRSFKNLCG